MSIKLMSRVYERECTHPEQSVLLAMADHADDDGKNCYPSVARIAWKTGYTVRSVQRIISALRDRKVLTLVEEARRYRPNEYRINVSALPAKKRFEPRQGRHFDTPAKSRRETHREAGEAEGRQNVTPASDTLRGDTGVASGVTNSAPGVTSEVGRGDTGVASGVTPMSPEPSVNHQDNHQLEPSGGNRARPRPKKNGHRPDISGDELKSADHDDELLSALAPTIEDVFGWMPFLASGRPEEWALPNVVALRRTFGRDTEAAEAWLRGLRNLPRDGWEFRPKNPEKLLPWLETNLADHRARATPRAERADQYADVVLR